MAVLEPRPEHPDRPSGEGPKADAIQFSMEEQLEMELSRREIDAVDSGSKLQWVALKYLDLWTEHRNAGAWMQGETEKIESLPHHALTRMELTDKIKAMTSLEALRTAAKDLMLLYYQRKAAARVLAFAGCLAFDSDAEAAEIRQSLDR